MIFSKCLYCSKQLRLRYRDEKKYCDNRCQKDHEYTLFIERWKKGEIPSEQLYRSNGSLSLFLRRYVLEKANYQCERCGWKEVNPYTKKVPLEVEHIDGDCTHNIETNLIALCPNCHSLTQTYKGANKGKGRKSRLGKDNRLPV